MEMLGTLREIDVRKASPPAARSLGFYYLCPEAHQLAGVMQSLEEWLEGPADAFHDFWMRSRIPLLCTAIVATGTLIVVLLAKLQATPRFVEHTIYLGLEAPPPTPLPPSAEPTAPSPTGWEEAMAGAPIRNAIVDQGNEQLLNASLSDEKQIDAEKLYQDAARAREAMRNNPKPKTDTEVASLVPNTPHKQVNIEGKRYHGPSVVSYSLPGRKAIWLPVPAYQCENGGPVIVDLVVSARGQVVEANIDLSHSSPDPCLHDAALAAARASTFTPRTDSQELQTGSITYLFVAQHQ